MEGTSLGPMVFSAWRTRTTSRPRGALFDALVVSLAFAESKLELTEPRPNTGDFNDRSSGIRSHFRACPLVSPLGARAARYTSFRRISFSLRANALSSAENFHRTCATSTEPMPASSSRRSRNLNARVDGESDRRTG